MLQSPTPSPYFEPSLGAPVPTPFSQWNLKVLALAGATCTIFLIYTYYQMLRQHCCVSNATMLPRNTGHRRVLNERGPNPSPQFERSGLDPYIKQSLPTLQYKKQRNDGEDSKSDTTDCAVCLSKFEGEWIKRLPNCHHFFHLGCIDTFFQSNSHCPLCRSHTFNLEYIVSIYALRETVSQLVISNG